FPTYIARFQLERTTPKKSGTDCGDSNAFRPFFQNRRPHRKSGGGVPFHVPGAGVEPARIAPLVFETSASTDSAIRASSRRANITNNRLTAKSEGCLSKPSKCLNLCKQSLAMPF